MGPGEPGRRLHRADELVGQMLKGAARRQRYPAAASFAAKQIAINDQFQEFSACAYATKRTVWTRKIKIRRPCS